MEHERLSRFDVAIWWHWPPLVCELPVIGVVSAVNAAEAVEAVMRAFGLKSAAKVAAGDLGRCFVHRAYGVRLIEERPLMRKKGEEFGNCVELGVIKKSVCHWAQCQLREEGLLMTEVRSWEEEEIQKYSIVDVCDVCGLPDKGDDWVVFTCGACGNRTHVECGVGGNQLDGCDPDFVDWLCNVCWADWEVADDEG
jgi:hypothetical protein